MRVNIFGESGSNPGRHGVGTTTTTRGRYKIVSRKVTSGLTKWWCKSQEITLVHFLSKWIPNKNTFKRSRSSSSPLGPKIWTDVGRSQKHRHSTIPIVFVSDSCPYRIHWGHFCMHVLSMLGKYFSYLKFFLWFKMSLKKSEWWLKMDFWNNILGAD